MVKSGQFSKTTSFSNFPKISNVLGFSVSAIIPSNFDAFTPNNVLKYTPPPPHFLSFQ
ncbi:MAG: hypothetical protein LBQ37_00070 [Elusimicrobiota bacterium]|nr:hypothetical protein [Elusimicrobiota bacterium]